MIAPTGGKRATVDPFVANKSSAHTYKPIETRANMMIGPFADGEPPLDDLDFLTLPIFASLAHCEHVLPVIIFPPHLWQ